VNPGTRGERAVKGKETVRLAEGDLVVIETCGGGGYGSPADRPPTLTAGTGGKDISHEARRQDRARDGAAKGMGWEICMTLAREGADLALAARDLPPLETLAREIEALGRRALVVACDVTASLPCSAWSPGCTRSTAGSTSSSTPPA